MAARFIPTDEQRTLVEETTSFGIPQDVIARLVRHQKTGKPVTSLTLRKYFKDEIALGLHRANVAVARSVFQKAVGDDKGSLQAAIFWLRCRGGWKDRPEAERAGDFADGKAGAVGGEMRLVVELIDPTRPREIESKSEPPMIELTPQTEVKEMPL